MRGETVFPIESLATDLTGVDELPGKVDGLHVTLDNSFLFVGLATLSAHPVSSFHDLHYILLQYFGIRTCRSLD